LYTNYNYIYFFVHRSYVNDPAQQDPFSTPLERQSFVGLYSSPEGIRAIDGPAKVRILEMLERHEMAFDDLVSMSGRAKSTVSVHLKDLTDTGIVGARVDPADARKKIFYLNSLYLAGADSEVRDWFDVNQYIRKDLSCHGNPASLYRFILSSIRLTLLHKGLTIDPVLHLAGLAAGHSIYPCIKASDLDLLVKNITNVWANNSLGTIELEYHNPVTLKIKDCFECIDFPISGKPACAFESGLLASIFSEFSGQQAKVVETHCYAMGDNLCRFEINEKW
jgi:predicted hydrocarbon binding protein